MTGHYSPLTSDFFSAAKIKCNFHSHQIFSAGYNTRLYMYLSIYNRYSVIAFQFPAFCRTLQITPDMVPVIPFWVSSFPSRVPLSCSKYAYYPPNLWILTHFWGIITKFSQIFCPLFCPFNEYKNCCISTFCA